MTCEDFVGTKTLEKNIVNRKTFNSKKKVNWLKTKYILLEKGKPNIIYMRTAKECRKKNKKWFFKYRAE